LTIRTGVVVFPSKDYKKSRPQYLCKINKSRAARQVFSITKFCSCRDKSRSLGYGNSSLKFDIVTLWVTIILEVPPDRGMKRVNVLSVVCQVLRQQLEEGDVSVYGLNHYLIGAIYAIQNNKAEAYISLQKAVDTGWRDFRLGLRNPLLENLHGDAKFQQKMATLKELVNEMRQQREEMERK